MAIKQEHYFFVGIGGSGMSALANLVSLAGHRVSGSDRGADRGDVPQKFAALARNGITLYPQDGSGVGPDVDYVVVSSAIEETIPDIRNARQAGITVLKRAELLARMFNIKRGIGIAGTSGKTTVTGMTGWVLHRLGLDPSIANGGVMPDFTGLETSFLGNAVGGASDIFVAEMDESDGTIALFNPEIAVLNNITLDHKPLEETGKLFGDFLSRARQQVVLNLDDARIAQMAGVYSQAVTFGIDHPEAMLNATNLRHRMDGISFEICDRREEPVLYSCDLRVPGKHNVSNALAALSVAAVLGLDMAQAVKALEGFGGVRRRLETLGVAGDVAVIDDFGHNPDKIQASLASLAAHQGRILVMFQPHGFAPMKMMRKELADVFAKGLRAQDILVMPEIFYAGGTVARDISSADLVADIRAMGGNAHFCENRAIAGEFLLEHARAGDRIVIMGARDDTLTGFALGLLDVLAKTGQEKGKVVTEPAA